MKKYCVKAWDGLMAWNMEFYEFEAENNEEATKIAQTWFDEDYLPETILDSSSYADYPDEDDYETEEEYYDAVRAVEDELRSELFWEFIEPEE